MLHSHYILHKPYGYVSQFIHNEPTRKNKKMLGELHDFTSGTMAIGRLDKDSEGLLLLTTDGKVSAKITGRGFEKEYYVQLDGLITQAALDQLRTGVDISVNKQIYRTLPGTATLLATPPEFPKRSKPVRDDRHGPTCWVSIVIREGKYRQVRKMTAAVGFPTLRLVRIRIGEWQLGELQSGEVKEVDRLV
ncbi:ribulose phosphate epimerase [Lewinellaceae bacterium SD302]|nr:ribulose phosphate epimerase [Lewinellaceae bacterium SD302]